MTESIQYDWEAYYKRFKELHGEPVESGGVALFPDGWTYSLSDFAGPEWPPPDDSRQLRNLQCKYWQVRKRLLQTEASKLRSQIQLASKFQAQKSAPLQQVSSGLNEQGLETLQVADIDFDAMQARLEWIQASVLKCSEKLEELTSNVQEEVI